MPSFILLSRHESQCMFIQAMICLVAMESSLSSSPAPPSATSTRTTRTRRPSSSSARVERYLGSKLAGRAEVKRVDSKITFIISGFLLKRLYIYCPPSTQSEGKWCKECRNSIHASTFHLSRIAIHVLTHPLFSFAIICTILVNCYVMVEPDTE